MKKQIFWWHIILFSYSILYVGFIAQLGDKGQLAPSIPVYGKTERRLIEEGLEVVPIRHLHGGIGGIDPLHRQFQGFPTSHGTHGRRSGKDALRFDAGRGKEGVGGFFF